MRTIRFTISTALLLTAACAPVTSRYGDPGESRSAGFLGSNVLTRRDISSVHTASDLYEVIQGLKPSMLVARGAQISVAMDGVLTGTVDRLRLINPAAVYEVRLLNGPEATFRFGTQNAGAVILVTTRMR